MQKKKVLEMKKEREEQIPCILQMNDSSRSKRKRERIMP